MPIVPMVVSTVDPGAIGAGYLWSNPSTEPPTVQVRNKTNTGWDTVAEGTIPAGATTVTGPDVFGASAVVGTALHYAREDHDHGLPANPVSGTLVAVPFIIDGAGSSPTTGIKGDVEVPFAGTIVSVRLFADQSGSCVIDIGKANYATWPTVSSICASAKPTLSSAQKAQDSTLTGWTKAISSGDILEYNLNSVATITRVTCSLVISRT